MKRVDMFRYICFLFISILGCFLLNQARVEAVMFPVDGYIYTSTDYDDFELAGLEVMGFNEVLSKMDQKRNKKELVVVIMDTGIDFKHEWFKGRILEKYALDCTGILGCTTLLTKTLVQDKNGHGSHVAGIIAKGTPSNVKLLPIKTHNDDGYSSSDIIAKAYKEVIKLKNKGVNIVAVNLSSSVGGNQVLTKIEEAYDLGILTIHAAGNESSEITGTSVTYYSTKNKMWITNIFTKKAIVVSALGTKFTCLGSDSENCKKRNKDLYNNFKVSSSISETDLISDYYFAEFSNYGDIVDFAAPGNEIISAVPQIAIDNDVTSSLYCDDVKNTCLYDGTSMAAPHVTAAIALIYAMKPELSMSEVEYILKKSAVDYWKSGHDKYFGRGVIDLRKAMQYIDFEIIVKQKFDFSITPLLPAQPVSFGSDKLVKFDRYLKYQKITIDGVPYTGFMLSNLVRNGFTLINVTDNHVIEIVYQKEFKITESVTGMGSIERNVSKIYGGNDITYRFIPANKYKVSEIWVDGKKLTGKEKTNAIKYGYTFENVDKNHTIKVTFVKKFLGLF